MLIASLGSYKLLFLEDMVWYSLAYDATVTSILFLMLVHMLVHYFMHY